MLHIKRTPNKETKNQKTTRDGATARRTRQMYKGQGDKEHDTYTLVTAEDWATGRGQKGGERTHGQHMKAEVRRDPWKGKP